MISSSSQKPTRTGSATRIVSLVLAVAGNILLIWLFWSALQSRDSVPLLVQAGPLVLAAEFLAIYAGGITSGKRVEAERSFAGTTLLPVPQKWRVLPVLLLMLAAALLAWFIQKPSLVFFFTASFFSKYFGHRAVQTYPFTVITIVWFLISLGILAIPASFLQYAAPFIENVQLQERVFLWGVVYFGVSTLLVSILFFKSRKTT